MKFIDGGVSAPKGFVTSGTLSKIKESRTKPDTALIYSEVPCVAAGVFTQNRVKAECVKLSKKHIEDGIAQAVIVNSGNANACTGEQGARAALRMAEAVASKMNLKPENVLVCSTGVIGQQLPVEKIEASVPSLVESLSKDGHIQAREAIMTTDTKYKEVAVEFEVGGKVVHIGTMAKGSGMIHINMGTMLGFITTDCAISKEMLKKALKESVAGTYNCISVDGDTSTNDTLLLLANGMAENKEITSEGEDYNTFLAALNEVNTKMARKIAGDGEGAEHLIECKITGASSVETARVLAKSVISSSLVKAAFFGKDANWGRILCAMGYSGAEFNTETVTAGFSSSAGYIQVCDKGTPVNFDEDKAKEILSQDEVTVLVELTDGNAEGTAWGCDLTYDYVKINGDYRT